MTEDEEDKWDRRIAEREGIFLAERAATKSPKMVSEDAAWRVAYLLGIVGFILGLAAGAALP